MVEQSEGSDKVVIDQVTDADAFFDDVRHRHTCINYNYNYNYYYYYYSLMNGHLLGSVSTCSNNYLILSGR